MTQAVVHGMYQDIVQNLTLYRIQAFADYPELVHAIFTRQGGLSRGPFAGLNLSPSVGDDPLVVTHNFERACQALNTTPKQTVSCHLVHGANVLTVTKANQQQVMGQADGLITGETGIYLAMRFGDCTPLIFFDPNRGAIGLTHAGWRGTLKNAAGATVNQMVSQLGCSPQNIMAVIGPAIGPCCYEVGPEVMAAAATAFSNVESLFDRRNGQTDRAYFDMWAANRRQLVASGVEQIFESGLCTACRTDLFFSHRAEKGRTGRFGVMIGLKGNI